MALRLTTEPEWTDHLQNLGIPTQFAKAYAVQFVEQQVPLSLLAVIKDDDLRDTYGVKLAGHRLAILHSNVQTQTSAQGPSTTHITHKPLVRHQAPQLKPSMSPSSFRAFVSHWTVYKNLVGIQHDDPNAAAQIFSLTCTDHPEIRQTIADYKPGHLTLNEAGYLEMLRKLLTSKATPETYRNKLFTMNQGTDETCQEWLKRLQEVAPDCEFTFLCPSDATTYHRFDETIIRTKFILGLTNRHIKQDLLAKSAELPSLDAVYSHATRMEATSRDLDSISKTVAAIQPYVQGYSSASEDDEVNRISNYRRQQKTRKQPSNRPSHSLRPCDGCGSTKHSSEERSTKCPAWKKSCNLCKRKGHFATVCRSNKNPDSANAVIALVNEDSKEPSNVITIEVAVADKQAGRTIHMKALPDTGASICVVGTAILHKLGIKPMTLNHTTRRIQTATGSKIHCMGWFQGSLTLGNSSTTQEVFVCDNINMFYLSKTGCIALGIIHKDFPRPIKDAAQSSRPSTEPWLTAILANLPERPKEMPYPPTKENIPRLEKCLLDLFAKTGFNPHKHDFFPKMTEVPKAKIHLPENAKPYFRATPNQVPHYWSTPTKALLDQSVTRGIIRKKPIGTASAWCSPMVITAKKSNTPDPKLRMTVDLQHLNSQCIRELHHVESPFRLASQVPVNIFKTILDAVDGYQAIELDEESIPLTAFITQWGPYEFLRVPAGLIDSGDKYTSRYDQVIQDVPRKVKCVDDTLLFDSSIHDAFFHTFDYLYKCASRGIVFNASKFKFCRQTVTFAGFTITPSGIKPSESTLTALKDFPTPKSTTDVRSWFGLVRQVAYAHSISEDLAPLRGLLKQQDGTKPRFFWSEDLQHAFEKSKDHIINSVREGIQAFDPKRQTYLHCDWSKEGVGFLLLQKHCECKMPEPQDPVSQCCHSGWKLTYAGSQFTTEVESRYSPTEGEALAVAWALKTSRLFTLGCPNLTIVTDHKPLLGILNERDLGSIKNPRLRRLKEHTLDYSFNIRYCPGKMHLGADALSRYPSKIPHDTHYERSMSDSCEDQIGSIISHAIDFICGTYDGGADANFPAAITLDKVELECIKDPNYSELHKLVTSGFPDQKAHVPDYAKTYWASAQKNTLSTFRNIVLHEEKPVIPQSLRTQIIRILHSAHQGCTGMVARATSSVHWPGIQRDILNYQSNCRACAEISPSLPREPLLPNKLPQRPFEVLCSDICQINGRYYLIVVDRFSGFLHIFYSRTSPTHEFLEKHLRDVFARYGRPDRLDTDGGPQYKSQGFARFLANWGIEHRISSPYYAQSNGRAELGVKTAKRLLKENTNPDGSLNNNKVACAILQYHNTPLRDGPMSPAQLLFGRALADFLPVNPREYQLHPYWQAQVDLSQQRRQLQHQSVAKRYNVGTRELRPLAPGGTVYVQNPATKRWDQSATVIEVLPYRKYKLRLNSTGNITFRNRRFLKPTQSTSFHETHPSGPKPLSTEETQPGCSQRKDQPSPCGEDGEEYLIQEEQPESSLPQETTSTREPLALRRLRPHNKPGLGEQ